MANDRDDPMWLPDEIKPRIEEDGSIFFYQMEDDSAYHPGRLVICSMPARQAAIVALNMMNGVPWFAASPIFRINRKVAAFCLANAETILSRVR